MMDNVNNRTVKVSDCSLRDACNAPGVDLTLGERVNIARMLDQLGIHEIESGAVSGNKSEDKILKSIAELNLQTETSWVHFCSNSRKVEDVIAQMKTFGFKSLFISIPSSDDFIKTKLGRSKRATIKLLEKASCLALKEGIKVAFSGEDAARADEEYLVDYVKAGADFGAWKFRFAESVSCLSPTDMTRKIELLKSKLDIPIEVHSHSGLGLAVTNSIAAIEAGADWVSTTIEGIGERGGNTSLGTILLYLNHFKKQKKFDLTGLKKLSEYFCESVKLPIHRFTPIVGKDSFSYEIMNQYENAGVYEVYTPESVGNQHNLIVGRKCDPRGIAKLSGMELSDSPKLEEEIRAFVMEHKNHLSKEELVHILNKYSHEFTKS